MSHYEEHRDFPRIVGWIFIIGASAALFVWCVVLMMYVQEPPRQWDFGAIPDVFRRPNDPLYTWLGREMTARHVRGILLRRYVWCDLWHAELHRLQTWSPVPLVEIDVADDELSVTSRTEGRIEALVEMLQR